MQMVITMGEDLIFILIDQSMPRTLSKLFTTTYNFSHKKHIAKIKCGMVANYNYQNQNLFITVW